MSLWETGIEPAQNYSFNYPGEVRLPLVNYAMGPLIEFDIVNKKSEEVPEHWIDKINLTNFI